MKPLKPEGPSKECADPVLPHEPAVVGQSHKQMHGKRGRQTLPVEGGRMDAEQGRQTSPWRRGAGGVSLALGFLARARMRLCAGPPTLPSRVHREVLQTS